MNTTTQTHQRIELLRLAKDSTKAISVETLVLPSFTGPKPPTSTAPGGISVQSRDKPVQATHANR